MNERFPLIETQDLNVFYGVLHVLKGINIKIFDGEIVALVGPNGAGKTTLLRSINGLLKPRTGKIYFEGENVSGLPPHVLAKKGLAHVPEGRRIFANLSVYENLLMGAYLRKRDQELEESLEYIFSLFPRLKERLHQNAGSLSGGEQQMLALGRALIAKPKVLLLDEPSLGLAPVVVDNIFEAICEINKKGVTTLLVEQNVVLAMEIASRAYVLETGKIACEGSCDELREIEHIRKVYLGG